jgi:prepilin-type N-terminal cleavage/methylation domain-containing protein
VIFRVKTNFPLSRNRRKAGFSLIEMLLTLVLVLGLVTASVMNFSGAFHRTGLDEGSERLVTMIRFAQAEAATSGRKVRLSFDIPENPSGETSGTELRDIQVLWEPDVLGQPGRFEPLSRRSWNDGSINEMVGVHSVRSLTDTGLSVVTRDTDAMDDLADESDFEAANRAVGWFGDSDETMVQSNAVETPRAQQLTFYPDGSSDAMEIVLASRKAEDSRLIAVRVQGVLGTVSRQEVDPDADEVPDENGPFD